MTKRRDEKEERLTRIALPSVSSFRSRLKKKMLFAKKVIGGESIHS